MIILACCSGQQSDFYFLIFKLDLVLNFTIINYFSGCLDIL